MGVPDLLRYAIPVFFVVIVLDYYQAMNSDPGQYSKKDSLNNFGLGVLSYVTATLSPVIPYSARHVGLTRHPSFIGTF
jgi:hypothetical protein